MNTFLNQMINKNNLTYTENGGLTYKTTQSKILDLFAVGGAYRSRTDADIILLFKNAFEEDPLLAIKCLFYIRDILCGQGERHFFRVAFRWLANNYPETAKKNLKNIPKYGRWDDLIYSTEGTPLEKEAFNIIKNQLELDNKTETPSLLGKWLPSQVTSSAKTKRLGYKLANYLGLTCRQYRKTLSSLRKKINVLERLMSANEWDKIDFSKIPSKAGIKYQNAFARRDVLIEKYNDFAKNKNTKVNADTLYPHDIAHKALRAYNLSIENPERLMLQKYWDNLKNFYDGKEENGIAVIDVSGSMHGTPIEAAISMGAYIADKSHGPFANYFITFSAHPELVRFEGVDIVDKLHRCIQADWEMNTNIQAVFDMLLSIAKNKNVNSEDMPKRIYIFSDMEFDDCVFFADDKGTYPNYYWDKWSSYYHVKSIDEANSDLEKIKKQWAAAGYEMPKVIFWNLNARQNRIPAIGEGFSYVSGFSPVMLETILSGKDGYDLMIAKLVESGRYDKIVI